MKVVITGSVPTAYQFKSINSIGLPVHKSGGGGYYVRELFNTKKEAVKHLKKIRDWLNKDGDHCKFNGTYLEYDAVTIRIEKASEL